jgi:hypothetical protein
MSTPVDWAAIVTEVREVVDESYPPDVARPSPIVELAGHLDRVTTAWPLIVDYTPGDCDRRGDLLSGPLFTSSDYPWPRCGDQWCEPILQIDLARWGERAQRDVGRGLLQLWEPQTYGKIRVIPESALNAPITGIPSERGTDYRSIVSDDDFDSDRPKWLECPGRITGFGEPFLDAAGWHLWRNIQYVIDDEEGMYPPALINRLCSIVESIEFPDPEDRHRAFGMCGGNISQTSEADNLPPVLLTIETDDRIYSIMGSTLCICYEGSVGEMSYSAHLYWE